MPKFTILPMILLAACLPVAGNELSADGGGETPPRVLPLPGIRPCCPEPTGADPLARLVQEVSVGSPVSYAGLTVYPIHWPRDPGHAAGADSLSDSLARGCLELRESPRGDVNWLRVSNRCGRFVFLMAGETVYGGKQDRFVAEDGLLAPWGGEVAVPVFCSERGRWDRRAVGFEAGAAVASPELRARIRGGASQDQVWQEVERETERWGAGSPTSRYGALYDRGPDAGRVREYQRRCADPLLDRRGVIGAIFVRGSRVVGADLFGSGELFRRELPRLVAAAAWGAWDDCHRCGPPAGVLEDALRSLARPARMSELSTYGVGSRHVSRSSAAMATVLVFDGAVVHASIELAQRPWR